MKKQKDISNKKFSIFDYTKKDCKKLHKEHCRRIAKENIVKELNQEYIDNLPCDGSCDYCKQLIKELEEQTK